jgi:hypothetical protein
MKCFEVKINGARVCTAGVEDGVLTAILSFVKQQDASKEAPEDQVRDRPESLDIRVGGLENIEPGASAHVEWLTQGISVGDEVTIRIVETPICDEPKSKEITYIECSFCGKKQSEVQKLIAGPGVHICNECVGDSSKALAEGEPTGKITMIIRRQSEARCSFCGQKPVDVAQIVGVPAARICNQCVKICVDVLEGND